MMKKNKIMIMVMLFTLYAASVVAQDDGWGDKNNNGPHLAPPNNITLVSYDSKTKTLSLLFNDSYESLELTIYKGDNIIIEDNVGGIEIGQYLVYSLLESVMGIYTIYIKTDEDTLYVFEEEFEE